MGLFLAIFLGMWVVTLIQEGIEVYLNMQILDAVRDWRDGSLPKRKIAKMQGMEYEELNELIKTLLKKRHIIWLAKINRDWYVILPSLPWLVASILDHLCGQHLVAICGAFPYLLLVSIPALFFSRLIHGWWSVTPVVFMGVFYATALTAIYLGSEIRILADATKHLGLCHQGEAILFQKAGFLTTEITWFRQLMIAELLAISAVIGAFLTVVWTYSPRLGGGRFPVTVRAQLWTLLCLIGSAWNYAIVYFLIFQPLTKLSHQINSLIMG